MTRWMTVFVALFLFASISTAQDTGFTGGVITATGTHVFGAHVAYLCSNRELMASGMYFVQLKSHTPLGQAVHRTRKLLLVK